MSNLELFIHYGFTTIAPIPPSLKDKSRFLVTPSEHDMIQMPYKTVKRFLLSGPLRSRVKKRCRLLKEQGLFDKVGEMEEDFKFCWSFPLVAKKCIVSFDDELEASILDRNGRDITTQFDLFDPKSGQSNYSLERLLTLFSLREIPNLSKTSMFFLI